MAFASASIAPSSTSSTGLPSARRSTTRSTSCRPTSTPGWSTTITGDRIRAAGASARPQCRPFLTRSLWQRRKLWRHDDGRQLYRLNQPTASVRPSLNYYNIRSLGVRRQVPHLHVLELAGGPQVADFAEQYSDVLHRRGRWARLFRSRRIGLRQGCELVRQGG